MELIYESGRIYALDEGGNTAAEVLFPEVSEGVVCMKRTFVDDSLRGRGLASRLVKAAADLLRAEGRKAEVTCPYAQKWFETHPEARDVLKEEPDGKNLD